jgi:hypothetical protein
MKKISKGKRVVHFFALEPLPAGPLPTGRQAVPTEGGAGRFNPLTPRILEYFIH